MLGIVRAKTGNALTVYGKHPVTKDYFTIGEETPISRALSAWVENGYKNLVQTSVSTIRSFRFWAKGHDKGTLICGIIKDSSDSMGRPFPLLVMGTGKVKGLKQHWEKVLYICEPIWYDLERFSARTFTDIHQMSQDLKETTFPSLDLRSLNEEMSETVIKTTSTASFRQEWQELDTKKETLIYFDCQHQTDQMQTVYQLHYSLKSMSKEVPNAVFLGGIPEKTCMAVFKRPLQINDFFKLWTITN